MAPSPTDTIFALSSGAPPAAIAVVRVSGPRAGDAVRSLAGRLPEPRHAAFARLRDPVGAELIDEALVLWFPGPRSETGEDTVEFQIHGGQAVIAAVLAALSRLDGFRLAEPGEFTRRAFENGRLDLTQVEGLADLVAAETQAQRRQAYGQFTGLLGDRAETWRGRLIEALALVEAAIDFVDEGDVPAGLVGQAIGLSRPLAVEIASALGSARYGERVRDGLSVVIAGPTNAGKSTLLNRLARREAAIVSPLPGTTRDLIEVRLDLDGFPVNVIDTAGIREASSDPVEQEGMRRARERAAQADLVLWLVDGSATEPALDNDALEAGIVRWIVVNKTDAMDERLRTRLFWRLREHQDVYAVSASTGDEVAALATAIGAFAAKHGGAEPALVTRERHRSILSDALEALQSAEILADARDGDELVAEQLRRAATALGRLTGRIDVEDLLDVIFREFCIGK